MLPSPTIAWHLLYKLFCVVTLLHSRIWYCSRCQVPATLYLREQLQHGRVLLLYSARTAVLVVVLSVCFSINTTRRKFHM